MTVVQLTKSAANDLDQLWDEDEDAAAEIVTALEEISNDPRLIDKLTTRFFRNDSKPDFEVERFLELWNSGEKILRLKHWNYQKRPVPYRVLYTQDRRADQFFILAVIHRSICYDTKHPIIDRVRRDYLALKISND